MSNNKSPTVLYAPPVEHEYDPFEPRAAMDEHEYDPFEVDARRKEHDPHGDYAFAGDAHATATRPPTVSNGIARPRLETTGRGRASTPNPSIDRLDASTPNRIDRFD